MCLNELLDEVENVLVLWASLKAQHINPKADMLGSNRPLRTNKSISDRASQGRVWFEYHKYIGEILRLRAATTINGILRKF